MLIYFSTIPIHTIYKYLFDLLFLLNMKQSCRTCRHLWVGRLPPFRSQPGLSPKITNESWCSVLCHLWLDTLTPPDSAHNQASTLSLPGCLAPCWVTQCSLLCAATQTSSSALASSLLQLLLLYRTLFRSLIISSVLLSPNQNPTSHYLPLFQ